jgi:hypothetical protein
MVHIYGYRQRIMIFGLFFLKKIEWIDGYKVVISYINFGGLVSLRISLNLVHRL